MKAVCISIHDVAPSTWSAARALIEAVRTVAAVPVTLLVVPDFHGVDGRRTRVAYLRELDRHLAHGDELALHGWNHLDCGSPRRGPADWLARSVYTAGEGEFAALSYAQACARLERGQQWFYRHGWRAEGFIAPAWLLSQESFRAVRCLRFLYTTTVRSLILPELQVRIASHAVCYSSRSALRRSLSLAWNAALFNCARRRTLLRIALHPADVRYPWILQQVQLGLAQALHERVAMTKAQFARALADEMKDPAKAARMGQEHGPMIPAPQLRGPCAPSLEPAAVQPPVPLRPR